MRGRDKVGAIVAAAGSSQRMGVDKLFAPLCGKPLLTEVIDVLHNSPSVDEMVIVLGERNLRRGQKLVEEQGWSKVVAVCRGGRRRQDSVKHGLTYLSSCSWVVVHDGSRPLLSVDLIERGLDEAQATGAAIAAVPVNDTIKLVSQDGFVGETPQRHLLWAVQTPQVFRFDILSRAHEQVQQDVTDDAMLVEQLGHAVKVYMGSYDNIKVTTPEDLALAEIILRGRRAS